MLKKIFTILLGLGSVFLIAQGLNAAEVNLYSARKEALIKPLLDKFTAQTDIRVNLVTGKADALLKRLQSEGVNSPADMLLTSDAGQLYRAKAGGILQAIESAALDKVIPAHYRDPDGQWYGLSLRARVIIHAKDRVKPEQLSTYEALADSQWKKRICIRSSSNIYNHSLVASLIAAHGEAQTEAWAKGLVANLAKSPAGGDRDQIKAVAAGLCDLAIANTYYLGAMLHADQAQQQAAAQVAVFWPNQQDRGAHVNISGAAVTKAAKNKENAIKLLEFLVSDQAQRWYAEKNYEYPVKTAIPISATLQVWGKFNTDTMNLSRLGELNPQAVKLMDRANWR